jgi:ActR/RegA family two-component response regulator
MTRKAILLVEDDPRFRGLVKRALKGEDYEIYEADSVASGIDQLSSNPIVRVILLDLSLKDGSGTDLLTKIEGSASKYRVIVLTAHEEHLAAELAKGLSVFNYLPKATHSFTQAIRFSVSQAFLDIERAPCPVRVFISYTNPDFDKVTWIYRRLKDNGFIPWIDKIDLQPGDAWDREIDKAIGECDCVVSCLSDIAVKRLSYFQRETQLAVARYDQLGQPFIIPLLFEKCDMPTEFIDRKIHHLTYDAFHDDWWTKLVSTLRSIYGRKV